MMQILRRLRDWYRAEREWAKAHAKARHTRRSRVRDLYHQVVVLGRRPGGEKK